jgi:hypothetical protein
VAHGEKVTPTVHVDEAATLLPQVLLATAKSPLGRILKKLTATFSWFVTVTVLTPLVFPCARVPKPRLAGATVTGVIPVPVSLAVCGLLLALSTTVSVPVSGATAVGGKCHQGWCNSRRPPTRRLRRFLPCW